VLSFSVRGSAGFGGLNAPLLLIVLPAKVIVPALVLLGIFSSLAIVVRDHRYIQWPHVARTLPYALVGVVFGVFVFKRLDTKDIEQGLGLFILAYGLYSLWRIARPAQPLRIPRALLAGVMGLVAGLIGTMFGALAGVFIAVYLNMLEMPKHEFRATMAATLALMGVARAVGYFAVDAITTDVLIAFAAALPLMGIGVVLGHRLHASLNQAGFTRLVGMLFVLIGGFLFLR
jgi:uncharacterized protein